MRVFQKVQLAHFWRVLLTLRIPAKVKPFVAYPLQINGEVMLFAYFEKDLKHGQFLKYFDRVVA